MLTRITNWFSTPFPPRASRRAIAAAIFLAVDAEWIAALTGNIVEKFEPTLALEWKVVLLLALCGLAFGLGWKLYKSYVQHHRRLNEKLDHVPPADILILPVSKPNRDEISKYGASVQLNAVKVFAEQGTGNAWLGQSAQWPAGSQPTLEDFCKADLCVGRVEAGYAFGEHFTWQTGFIVTKAILEQNAKRLKAIHLVPSNETREFAEHYYAKILAALVERYLKDKTIRTECKVAAESGYCEPQNRILYIVYHEGVDYSDFEGIQKKVFEIVKLETDMRGPVMRKPVKVIVDITGGTAAFTATAAIASTRRDICYCHVPETEETPCTPLFYDVITEKADVRGTG